MHEAPQHTAGRVRRCRHVSRSLARAWAGTLLVLLAACLAPAPRAAAASAPPGDEATDVKSTRLAELSEIQTLAETIRGLRFKQPPVYKPLQQDELVPYFRKQVLEEYKEGELENMLLAYEKLGLLPRSDGLVDDLVKAYADGVMAFYDQDTDTVHLIADLKVPAVMQRIAELHELVHVLQDQHFDINALPLKGKLTDPATAALALIEGDAMVATYEYARKYAPLTLPDLIETVLGVASDAPVVPYVVERETAFVYTNGFDLAKALHKRGGWAAVNEAFAAPPASTEQVLHYREKYIEARDEPTPVELPDSSTANCS